MKDLPIVGLILAALLLIGVLAFAALIDAVELSGPHGTAWAVHARASSTYGG